MGKRYNIGYPRNYKTRDGRPQTHWINVGVAFESQKGDGFDAYLYVIPPMEEGPDGSMCARLVVRLPDDEQTKQQQGQRGAAGGRQQNSQRPQGQRQQSEQKPENDDHDDIPF